MYWLGYSSMWYRAGGDQPSAFQVKINSNLSLETRAILLDTISWTSKAFVSEELELAHQKEGAPLQKLWQELEPSPQSNQSSHDREHAFSLAIAAGRAADEGAAQDNPTHHWHVYQAYKQLIAGSEAKGAQPVDKPNSTDEPPEESLRLEALTYINNQRRALHNRRLFRTRNGRYGVGHRTLERGDMCGVIRGANVPFVLRRAESELGCNGQIVQDQANAYRLVGEAYIQGIMKGEALDMLDADSRNSPSDVCAVAEVDIVLL